MEVDHEELSLVEITLLENILPECEKRRTRSKLCRKGRKGFKGLKKGAVPSSNEA